MCAAYLISASYDKEIRFWDGATGRPVHSFPFPDSQVNALLLIPNTTYLAVAGFGVVRVYDIGGHSTPSGGVSGGSNQMPPLLSSFENQSAMNITSLGSFQLNLLRGAASVFGSSTENSSSSFFAGTVDLGTTQRSRLDSLELSTALYATSEDGHIRFFNATNPSSLPLIWDISTSAAITCSALSPDRQTLFTGSQIGRVSVWHLPTIIEVAMKHVKNSPGASYGQKPLQEISFDTDYTAIRSIAIEPLARWAVVATNAGKLHFLRFLKEPSAASASVLEQTRNNESKQDPSTAKDTDSLKDESLTANNRRDSAESGGNASNDADIIHLESVYRPPAANNDVDTGGVKNNALEATARPNGEAPTITFVTDSETPSIPTKELHMDPASNSESPSNDVSPKDTTFQQQFLMEVFYSFQAHYKYILKVAISPSTDLLVTCCADYTVGRFLIPKELQQGTAFGTKHSADELSNTQGSEHMVSATERMNSDGVEGLPGRRISQTEAPEVALAVASLLQPAAGRENTQNASADQLEGAEAKALEPPIVGGGRKSSANVSGGPSPQAAEKREGKGTATSADFPDASSLQFSVVPSLTVEGNTQLHSTGVLQFVALKPLTGHTRWVWDCVFSDCGRYLFTACSDNSLRMWTGLLTDRVQSTCFTGHKRPVVCCILYYEKRW